MGLEFWLYIYHLFIVLWFAFFVCGLCLWLCVWFVADLCLEHLSGICGNMCLCARVWYL
jgi:hypothetical protein